MTDLSMQEDSAHLEIVSTKLIFGQYFGCRCMLAGGFEVFCYSEYLSLWSIFNCSLGIVLRVEQEQQFPGQSWLD